MKKILSITVAFIFCGLINAQQKATLPLKLPMSFSGTYGELRHTHFHSGFDWRVGGKTGDPICAIMSGYVSRISVSVSGYGNAVYINHQDGTMSVYGHMLSFSPEIAKRVKEEQYSQKNFSVNILLSEGEIKVRQGDMIGKVGSTGSSSGPHLHMEIREDDGNKPFNYIARGYYNVKDALSPVFRKVAFYSYQDSTGIPVIGKIVEMKPPWSNNVLKLPQKSYVGIDAVDRMEGTPNKLAVEQYRVILDGKTIFGFKVGDVSYDEDKYIQSVIQYGESFRGGADLVKSLVEPGNRLSYKMEYENNGLIVLDDYDNHDLMIEVFDIFGNKSELNFKVTRADVENSFEFSENVSKEPMLWFMPNIFKNDDVSFSVPLGSLYNSIYFPNKKISEPDTLSGIYSSVWKLGDENVPLHKKANIRFFVNLPEKLRSKLLIAGIENGKTVFAASADWHEGVVSAKVGFGTYYVSIDTIAPEVRFIFPKGGRVNASGIFYIQAKDDFSGIGEYSVEIDGKWTLSCFKRDRITVFLDKEKVKKGKHSAKVYVADKCGNKTIKEISFIW